MIVRPYVAAIRHADDARIPWRANSINGDESMQTTYLEPISDRTSTAPRKTKASKKPGRPPTVRLRSLTTTIEAVARDAFDDALHQIWFNGFCAGAASVAPGHEERCARCDEPFVGCAGSDTYYSSRCRYSMVKRRYRARLRLRRGGQP